MRYRDLRGALASSAAICAVAIATPAMAQTKSFDVPAQSAATGIPELATQADVQILVSADAVQGKAIRAIKGSMTVDQAVRRAAADAGLRVVSSDGRTYTLAARGSSNQGNVSTPAADDGGYRADEIVVTAQKRVESVQDVPIAITALSQKNLEEQKIEGGPDIMRAVPNLTFSKSNFTSYNISIRGVGTKAISATSDPGVAVSFNNVAMIHNRFFEQEFFDMERMEVLRGPQGTLYGRNATGGVINLITAKPKLHTFEGSIKGEVGNFNSRRMVGMLNMPIVTDELGLRVAGSMTQRDGYDYNSITDNRVNGRDLWSLRATLGFEKPWLRGSIIWERFREKDNRSRTGKQLCHRDDSPEVIGSTPTQQTFSEPSLAGAFGRVQGLRAAMFSQGCKPGSLYDEGAYGTPNGLAINYISGLTTATELLGIGRDENGNKAFLLRPEVDPYGGLMQSRNLREIASIRDPRYRADSDILSINLDFDVSDNLTLSSQTAWNWDKVYSFQDYNRFNTVPIFSDTSGWKTAAGNPSMYRGLAPGGVFCDPQIGCSSSLAVFDVSSADSKQFAQEVRLQSNFGGPFNFSMGGNFTRFTTRNEYYVMSNVLTAIAMIQPFNNTVDRTVCRRTDWIIPGGDLVPIKNSACPYIDPNPVESIDGDGHNYFRSSNPYELRSWAGFAEAYYQISPQLKLTAGARFTRDEKRFTVVPSQLLPAPTAEAGGFVGTGHPATGEVRKKWGEWTGRVGLDWQPSLGFTDQSLFYAFISRGYKAGGVNPPPPGFATPQQLIDYGVLTPEEVEIYSQPGFDFLPGLTLTGVNYGQTFEPEFVDALEVGMKNSLMGGRLTLNANAFFYSYKNYQVSQIRDRTAVNENFDAKIWGAELSALFEPVDRLRLNANIGYLRTRIGKGERSIDPMNRTLGNPDYVLTRPWVQLPSNCVIPTHMAEAWLNSANGIQRNWTMCGGLGGLLGVLYGRGLMDPRTGDLYDSANYPELNGGAGFYTELGGNELPNSPRWTANLGAEYTVPFDGDWSATLRGDAYWQAKSWARVYNRSYS